MSPAQLTKQSANWQVNDWIAVSGTGFSPFETEFVQIASFGALTAQGRVINLTQPLKFYHFGSTAPVNWHFGELRRRTGPRLLLRRRRQELGSRRTG